jgi:hypothetical protein
VNFLFNCLTNSFVSNRKQLHIAVDTQRIYLVQRDTMSKVGKVHTIHGHLETCSLEWKDWSVCDNTYFELIYID